MVDISTPCLVGSIQAVHRQVCAERSQLEAMDEGDEDAEGLSLSLSDLEKVLNELCGVFEDARRQGHDLPSLGSLLI